MPPHFEIQNYYQNKPKLNGVYSRDNLLDKIKDGAYAINTLHECDKCLNSLDELVCNKKQCYLLK